MVASQINNDYYLLKYIYERDYIFIHINKTAGSSVSKLLGLDRMHLSAFAIRNMIREEYWEKKFKFAFVRNPWDRVVSQYFHRQKVNQQSIGSDNIEFNDWVKACYKDQDKAFINYNLMFIPQLDWITDMSGNIILDHIGRYENLAEEIAFLKTKLNIKNNLTHLRASNRDHYHNYYDNETKNIVGDYFLKDVDAFDYQF